MRESESEEAVHDPGLYGLVLPTGWYLAIGDGWDYMDKLEEEQAVALSRAGETLFFSTEDSAMTTRLAAYEQGKLAWGITYDGSDGVGEAELEGTPLQLVTDAFSKVRSEQEAAGGPKADVDHIYELTAEVARTLTGFRHDQTLGDGEILPIDILTPGP